MTPDPTSDQPRWTCDDPGPVRYGETGITAVLRGIATHDEWANAERDMVAAVRDAAEARSHCSDTRAAPRHRGRAVSRDHLVGPLALAGYVSGVGVAAMGATCIAVDTGIDTAGGLGWLRWAAVTIGTLAAAWTWTVYATTGRDRRPDPFPHPQPTPPPWVNDGTRP